MAETIGAVFRPASVRGAGWELAAAGLVRALLWLTAPMLVLQVFDRALPSAQTTDLIPLAVVVVIALAVRCGLDLAAAAMTETWGHARRRTAIRSAIADLFSDKRQGAAAAPPRLEMISGPVSALSILAGLPVLAGMLIYLAGVIAVPALIVACAGAVTAYLINRNAAPAGDDMSRPGNEFAEHILDAIWTVKAMGAENLVLRQAEIAARADLTATRTKVRPLLSIGRTAAWFDRAAVVLVVLTGTVLCLNGLITEGQLVAGVLIAGVMVRDAFHGTAVWTQGRAARDAIPMQDREGGQTAEPLPRITGNLMLNRVTFDEPADGIRAVARLVFDRIRIEIDAGETVLITGDDIRAQTDLLRLMAGLDRPQSGTVTVDGYDLAAFRPDSIRRQIAYVPPLGDVLPGTLLENLTAFDTGRTADALGAARLTGLDVKAACLADGFDTRLEGGGGGFPAGFRQHLAITRALAFKPKVLLLDHATENLDSQDLRAFADVLERLKGRVTVVFASTQAGLRAMADREIDLGDLKPASELGAADENDDPGDGDGISAGPDGEG